MSCSEDAGGECIWESPSGKEATNSQGTTGTLEAQNHEEHTEYLILHYSMYGTAWCYGNLVGLANDGKIFMEEDGQGGRKVVGTMTNPTWYDSLDDAKKGNMGTIEVVIHVSGDSWQGSWRDMYLWVTCVRCCEFV